MLLPAQPMEGKETILKSIEQICTRSPVDTL
jgi:hypothetical protein